ncbi:MAG: DUF4058 family protein [Isosphaeraceae bacterium]
MPLHDWTRVPSALFHDFHQSWTIRIKDALNAGILPEGYSALAEQRSGRIEADVLTFQRHPMPSAGHGGRAVLAERPATMFVSRSNREHYAEKANRIAIRHHLGRVVAVIEIVSPGNKDSRAALRDFAGKVVDLLSRDVHILLMDPFPPGPRDPSGLHKVIWDEFLEEPFDFPPGKDRLLASYECGEARRVAYVEPIGIGEDLPSMPLFLAPDWYVAAPLEPTYQATWEASPSALRRAVETGILPDPEAEEA